MAIDAQELWTYVNDQTDPSNPGGSQPDRNYWNLTWNLRLEEINEVRTDVTVQRTTPEKVEAGKVSEGLPIQILRDTVVPSEYDTNLKPQIGEQQDTIAQKQHERDEIAFILQGTGNLSSQGATALFGFTDESKAQILSMFPNTTWPLTRANLIALQTRDGTDAEANWGLAVTNGDMLAAEEYAKSLPTYPATSLYPELRP